MGCITSKRSTNLRDPLLENRTESRASLSRQSEMVGKIAPEMQTGNSFGVQQMQKNLSPNTTQRMVAEDPDPDVLEGDEIEEPANTKTSSTAYIEVARGKSVVLTPPSELLTVQYWISKRGHMVRTWKKRYCVIEKHELKYYTAPLGQAPYGKGLKGELAFLGAVCHSNIDYKDHTISVEICGSKGDKDLLFELDLSEESLEHLRLLTWSIRKNTLTYLLQNYKTQNLFEGKSKDKDNKFELCEDWMENEKSMYHKAFAQWRLPRLFRVRQYQKNGSTKIRPCMMKLWSGFESFDTTGTAYDHAHLESEECNAYEVSRHFGLQWEFLPASNANGSSGTLTNRAFTMKGVHTVSFADIADVTLEDVPGMTNDNTNTSTSHTACLNRPTKLLSIVTKYGYSIDVVACCVDEHEGALMGLVHILLYHLTEKKLTAAMKQNTVASAKIDTLSSCPIVKAKNKLLT